MSSELELRRKWTLRAHGQQVVFIKKPIEHTHHVLMMIITQSRIASHMGEKVACGA